MYVVDYKWKILPTVWAREGYNQRSSLHFADALSILKHSCTSRNEVLYPVLLVILTFIGAIAPSTICRNRLGPATACWIRIGLLVGIFLLSRSLCLKRGG